MTFGLPCQPELIHSSVDNFDLSTRRFKRPTTNDRSAGWVDYTDDAIAACRRFKQEAKDEPSGASQHGWARMPGHYPRTSGANSQVLGKAESKSLVSCGDQLAAGFANLILSNLNTIACLAGICIDGKTCLTNTTCFSTDILDTKSLLGFTSTNSFTCFHCGE